MNNPHTDGLDRFVELRLTVRNQALIYWSLRHIQKLKSGHTQARHEDQYTAAGEDVHGHCCPGPGVGVAARGEGVASQREEDGEAEGVLDYIQPLSFDVCCGPLVRGYFRDLLVQTLHVWTATEQRHSL
eukprot:CAMPEP_0173348974 /NCGR_PEP_ID=MMETSP1144-20121109/14047_1 /TAXON_ID=483371 /ORGANISM="non described non described, Strain CCMP2298" /LENGTH=128 /DNA_ID=CAMNT_0014296711 /DNA_START=216 /DNA_END=602 /DNA_ORIENTATION=-